MPYRYLPLLLALFSVAFFSCNRSPEDLPKYKKKFRTQIASFEKEKLQTDKKVEDGLNSLSTLSQANENAKKTDQEFNRVYGKWNQVRKQVDQLNKEYESLKQDAENLFSALERQTASLRDETTKADLNKAIKESRVEYDKTLSRTATAIEELRGLYDEGYDNIKALEVLVSISQIDVINKSLENIENRVKTIMSDLTQTVDESKALFENRIGGV